MPRIIPMVRKVDIVYGPLVDAQEFPEDVDVTLVEGAVSTQEDVDKLQQIRSAHQDAGLAGRLRGDRQCAGHAQHDSREQAVAAHLCGGADGERCIPARRVPPAAEAGAPGAGLREGGSFTCPAVRRPPRSSAELLNNLLEGRKPDLSAKMKFG